MGEDDKVLFVRDLALAVADGSDLAVRRHRPEASDIAVSLRWATAVVTKQTRARPDGETTESGGTAEPAGDA